MLRTREINQMDALEALRDIAASCPQLRDPMLRVYCDKNLECFARTCFPQTCKLEFGPIHKDYLASMQDIVENGGNKAIALGRGSGKSALAKIAMIWAPITGRRHFGVYLTATAKMSKRGLKNIRNELCDNDNLYRLYPKEIHPFRMLKGSGRKANSQSWNGRLTGVTVGEVITFGRTGTKADGASITTASTTSNFRGLQYVDNDGVTHRPDFALMDDLQSADSAKSPYQCENLESIIEGDILGLAGPDETITALFIGTPIYENDLVERYLAKGHWNGMRVPILLSMPTNMDLWEKWKEISTTAGKTAKADALAFWHANREAMQAGAVSSWAARMSKTDPDSVYYAMRKWAENETAFNSEYQLKPKSLSQSFGSSMIEHGWTERNSGKFKEGEVAAGAITTVGIDVNMNALSFHVMTDDHRIVSYGYWPKQVGQVTSVKEIENTISAAYPRVTLQESVEAALEDLVKQLHHRFGQKVTIIDNGWHATADAVYSVSRRLSKDLGSIVMPSFGRYVKVTDRSMSEWTKRPGEICFSCGRLTKKDGNIYFVLDPNFMKSNISRLIANQRLQIYQGKHPLLADHFSAEYYRTLESAMRSQTEWALIPGRTENHQFDACCLAYAGQEYLVKRKPKQTTKDDVKAQADGPPAPPRKSTIKI